MHEPRSIDPGRQIDWGRTSIDYAAHRPGPPARLFDLLAALGIGLAGQRVLDLGTGTGLLACEFARRGCSVSGTDISPGQIDAARRAAAGAGLNIRFELAPAEAGPFADASFDVVSASQCWMYFDPVRTIAEVKRLLAPGGVLATTHFSWLPERDPVARASEALVLKFNPDWQGAAWNGKVPHTPQWSQQRARVRAMFWFDHAVPFTVDSWCGRMRACRGVGATLSATDVARFDAEHRELLARIAPPNFSVWHRVDAHVFEPL